MACSLSDETTNTVVVCLDYLAQEPNEILKLKPTTTYVPACLMDWWKCRLSCLAKISPQSGQGHTAAVAALIDELPLPLPLPGSTTMWHS
jgi:hypothetical protein